MKKKHIWLLWILIIIIFYAIIKIDYYLTLQYNFKGTIDSLTYDSKNIPTVTIKGIQYKLSYDTWDFENNKIEIGDSLIKRKGNMDLLLIKYNSRDTINLLYKEKN